MLLEILFYIAMLILLFSGTALTLWGIFAWLDQREVRRITVELEKDARRRW